MPFGIYIYIYMCVVLPVRASTLDPIRICGRNPRLDFGLCFEHHGNRHILGHSFTNVQGHSIPQTTEKPQSAIFEEGTDFGLRGNQACLKTAFGQVREMERSLHSTSQDPQATAKEKNIKMAQRIKAT